MESELREHVAAKVHGFYWNQDLNCATSNLLLLAEQFEVALSTQVLDAALGMHGAAKYGAQCGLVEGGLLFIGIIGRARGLPDERTTQACQDFARRFEARFGSLLCRELRPQGFPPELAGEHICEDLTVDAVLFSIAFVEDWLKLEQPRRGVSADG